MTADPHGPHDGRTTTVRVVRTTAAIAALVGAIGLAGWIFGMDGLKRVLPDLESMKGNTATCIFLLGAAMWSTTEPRVPRRVPIALAAIVGTVGVLTVIQYAASVDFGIDQLLFTGDQALTHPGRMAPTTAAAFTLMSASLLSLFAGRVLLAHVTAAITFLTVLVAIQGYLFGVEGLYTVSVYASMALHTAVGLMAASIAVLATEPERGLTRSFVDPGVAGILTRRLLPLAVVVPIVVGWLIVQGEVAGLYESRFGTSIAMVSTVLLLGLLIVQTATIIRRVDAQRAAARDELRRLNLELEERIEQRTQALADAEARSRELFENSVVAIGRSTADGRFLVVNQAAADLIGYASPEEMVRDANAADFWVDPSQRDRAFTTMRREGEIRDFLAEMQRRDGTRIHASISAQALRADDGTITGWELSLVDLTDLVTAQRALAESETFFRTIAENVSDLIVRMDTAGTITYASPAATPLLGYEPEEMIGRTALDFIPSEGEQEIQRVYGRVFNGESAATKQPVTRKDGSAIWMEGIASPTIDPRTGVTTGIIWLVRDATQQVAELEAERWVAAREQQLNQLKNEFVGIVAHDLKSPMTVIGGFADIMVQQWGELSDEDKIGFLARIRDNVTRLSTLVDDVLQVSKIESGEMDLRLGPTDLGALIRPMLDELDQANPDRSIEAEIPDGLPPVMVDPDRTWRVIQNLLSNALKFSDDTVRVGVTERDGAACVTVADRGAGISPADMDRLFQRFSRIEQPKGKTVKGTGLGLYIAKQLVEAQGGRIWAESTPGEGSTFHFTVPFAGAEGGTG